ncbi:MAG: trypsin-like serine protease [Myxococcota bacterium]
MQSRAFAVLVGAVGASLALAYGCSQHAGEDVGKSEGAIQWAYVSSSQTAVGKGAHLVTSWGSGRKAKSVGYVRPFSNTWSHSGLESTCGATFISDRYAITAAHCVDKWNLPTCYSSSASPGSALKVVQVTTTSLDINEYGQQSVVTGEWPAWTRADPLTSGEGYTLTEHTCYVRARCDNQSGTNPDLHFGRCNCPDDSANFNGQVVDIALLYCPNRSKVGSNWSEVASTAETTNTSVESWWFHEVPDLSIDQNPFPLYQPAYNYQHYYLLQDDRTQNWHYNSQNHTLQLLPIVSHMDVSGQDYYITAAGTTYASTNISICHGTSGSGVFVGTAQGTAINWNDANPRLLGPAVYGDLFATTHLCQEINVDPGSTTRMQFVKQKFTRMLERVSYGGTQVVLADRGD